MSYLEKYAYCVDEERTHKALEIIASNLEHEASRETLLKCFSFMDVTTLHTNDTVDSVKALVEKVNAVGEQYPDYPVPASVCVYPNFASVVKETKKSDELHVTVVSGCFPSSQSFLEVKVRECELAVEQGADEVDIVLALNAFNAKDYEAASEEIKAMKAAIDKTAAKLGKEVVLKVILETGLLKTIENIANASFLAMEAGADFIKTSTGKVDVNATPVAAYTMCECIKLFSEKTGRKVGFKAAGGISDAKDALCYYYIGKSVLGEEWMNKKYFRFGVSRLGNSLMSAIEQSTVKFF